MIRAGALALLLGACAFPPSFTPVGLEEDPDAGSVDPGDGGVIVPCDENCARCVGDRCIVAVEGAACDPAAGEPRCEEGRVCFEARCRRRDCTGASCACPINCAGRCEDGACVPAGPGETCRAGGAGQACLAGMACSAGQCLAASAGVAPEAYFAALRERTCAFLVRCGEWPAALGEKCPDALFPEQSVFGSIPVALQAVSRGEASYDAAAAGACLAALPTAACAGGVPDACARVFTGRGALGQACTGDASCARGSFCRRSDLSGVSCAGTCAARLRAFDRCDSGQPCAEDTLCLGPVNERLCMPRLRPAAAGESCAASRPPCASASLVCGSAGKCVAPAAEGASCAGSGCAEGQVCTAAAGGRAVCQKRAGIGETCASSDVCTPPGARLALASCVDGRCARLPATGPAVFEGHLPNRCDPEAAWTDASGNCQPVQPVDGPCLTSDMCGLLSGRVCAFGTCLAPIACE